MSCALLPAAVPRRCKQEKHSGRAFLLRNRPSYNHRRNRKRLLHSPGSGLSGGKNTAALFTLHNARLREDGNACGGKEPSLCPNAHYRARSIPAFSPLPSGRRLRHVEHFQFEMLRISNHTACRFTEKTRFFRPLLAGRHRAASRFTFSKPKRSKKPKTACQQITSIFSARQKSLFHGASGGRLPGEELPRPRAVHLPEQSALGKGWGELEGGREKPLAPAEGFPFPPQSQYTLTEYRAAGRRGQPARPRGVRPRGLPPAPGHGRAWCGRR